MLAFDRVCAEAAYRRGVVKGFLIGEVAEGATYCFKMKWLMALLLKWTHSSIQPEDDTTYHFCTYL